MLRRGLPLFKSNKFAMLLAGCGHEDGTEIQEAVSTMVQVSLRGATVDCFAPSGLLQSETINHATSKPQSFLAAPRNVFNESARLARGNVKPLDELSAEGYDGLFIPGGYGVMKNLLFQKKKENWWMATIRDDVQDTIKDFHSSGKPIGACCISPILLARVLGTVSGGPGLKIAFNGEGAEGFGNELVDCPVNEAVVDEANMVATTPAYMASGATPGEVFTGIGHMVDAVLNFAGVEQAESTSTAKDGSDPAAQAFRQALGGIGIDFTEGIKED